MLLADPRSGSFWLFGGEGEQGARGDLWRLDPFAGVWTAVVPELQSPGRRTRVASASVSGTGYVYGGERDGDLVNGLWALDFATGRWFRVDGQSPGPGPRAGATLAPSTAREVLILYGGRTSSGPTNDLWAFDLGSRRWTLVEPPCTVGECPPAAPGALAVVSASGNRVHVVGPSAGEKAGERFFRHVPGEGWAPASRILGDPTAGDCDGDSLRDPSDLLACGATEDWWAPLGRTVCDRTGGSVCDAPAVAAAVSRLDRRQVEAIDVRGSLLALVRRREVCVFDLTDPRSPADLACERLVGKGEDVATLGSLLLVANDRGLTVIDFEDPAQPLSLAHVETCGKALAVERTGRRAVVLTRLGLETFDLSDPELPVRESFVAIVPRRGGPPPWLSERCGDWDAAIRAPLGPRREGERLLSVEGTLAVVARGNKLVVLDYGRPASPTARSEVDVGGRIRAARLGAARAYLVVGGRGRGYGRTRLPTLDLTDPSAPVFLADHAVEDWARGRSDGEGFAARVRRRRVEVAGFEVCE